MQTATKEILARSSQPCSSGKNTRTKKAVKVFQNSSWPTAKKRRETQKTRQQMQEEIKKCLLEAIFGTFFTLLKGIHLHTAQLQLHKCPVAGGSRGQLKNMIL